MSRMRLRISLYPYLSCVFTKAGLNKKALEDCPDAQKPLVWTSCGGGSSATCAHREGGRVGLGISPAVSRAKGPVAQAQSVLQCPLRREAGGTLLSLEGLCPFASTLTSTHLPRFSCVRCARSCVRVFVALLCTLWKRVCAGPPGQGLAVGGCSPNCGSLGVSRTVRCSWETPVLQL